MRTIPSKERYLIIAMGFVISLLGLPILNNLDVPQILASHGISYATFAVTLVLVAPFLLLAGAYVLALLPIREESAAQLSRYAVIGCFNVALNASIFNVFILVTGISTGIMVTVFAVITFFIVVTQAFFWSAFWTFKNTPSQNKKRQYINFFAVSGIVAIVNISFIYFMTSVIGAPAGVSGALWANIALLCTIFSALIGNFLGYKYFVFAI